MNPLEKTEMRLGEAKFFLDHLRKSYPAYPDTLYYLSAFIESSRSVMWIMKAECIDIPGWKKWYDEKLPSEEEELFLKSINDIRVRSTKKSPVSLTGNVDITIPSHSIPPEVRDEMELLPRGTKFKLIMVPRESDTSNELARKEKNYFYFPVTQLQKVYLSVDEFPDEDILGVCEKYLNILQEMVEQCKKEFFA